ALISRTWWVSPPEQKLPPAPRITTTSACCAASSRAFASSSASWVVIAFMACGRFSVSVHTESTSERCTRVLVPFVSLLDRIDGHSNVCPSVMSGHTVKPKPSATVPRCVGVLGAGTMGAGIAQLTVQAGAAALLFDPVPEALSAGVERVEAGLDKLAARGRISTEEAGAAKARLQPVDDLRRLAPAELVIEAAPERL